MEHEKQTKQSILSHKYITSSYRRGMGFLSREKFGKLIEGVKEAEEAENHVAGKAEAPADIDITIRAVCEDGDIGCLLYDCSADPLEGLTGDSKLLLPRFKVICNQLFEAFSCIHTAQVTHGNINLHSLRFQRTPTHEYEVRVLGFEKACYHSDFSDSETFRLAAAKDVEALAHSIHSLQREDPDETLELFLTKTPSGDDRLLLAHMLTAMKRTDGKPLVVELRRHPFLLEAGQSAKFVSQIADGILASWPWTDFVTQVVAKDINKAYFTWHGMAPIQILDYLDLLKKDDKRNEKIDDFLELKVYMLELTARGLGKERDISTFETVRHFRNSSSATARLGPPNAKYTNSAFDLIRLIRNICEHHLTLNLSLQQRLTPMPAALGAIIANLFPMLVLICYRTAYISKPQRGI